jgi:hypothetical protein
MKLIGTGILILSVLSVAFGSLPLVRSKAPSVSQTDSLPSEAIAFAGGPVSLGSGSARITLEPVAESSTAGRTLAARIGSLARGRHIYLVVRDLRVVGQPGVLFRLYIDLPSEAKPIRTDPHYVGALNFYNAAEPGRFDANEKNPMFVSYDITRVLRNLRAQKLLSDQTTLTIIPSGTPATQSDPRIGRIEIVEQ